MALAPSMVLLSVITTQCTCLSKYSTVGGILVLVVRRLGEWSQRNIAAEISTSDYEMLRRAGRFFAEVKGIRRLCGVATYRTVRWNCPTTGILWCASRACFWFPGLIYLRRVPRYVTAHSYGIRRSDYPCLLGFCRRRSTEACWRRGWSPTEG